MGTNVMSEDVENTFQHVKQNTVPDEFRALTYQTVFNLQQFVDHLTERAAFLQSWLTAGSPRKIELSALSHPQCLLVALLQVNTYILIK